MQEGQHTANQNEIGLASATGKQNLTYHLPSLMDMQRHYVVDLNVRISKVDGAGEESAVPNVKFWSQVDKEISKLVTQLEKLSENARDEAYR